MQGKPLPGEVYTVDIRVLVNDRALHNVTPFPTFLLLPQNARMSGMRVKNVPVNYAMRSSGPVTSSPHAVSGMASELASSASPNPSARYKDAFVPRQGTF